jgi:hypothetical protein
MNKIFKVRMRRHANSVKSYSMLFGKLGSELAVLSVELTSSSKGESYFRLHLNSLNHGYISR